MSFMNSSTQKCQACGKMVYQMEPHLNLDGMIFHQACAKCSECGCKISLSNFAKIFNPIDHSVVLLCTTHYDARKEFFGGGIGSTRAGRGMLSTHNLPPEHEFPTLGVHLSFLHDFIAQHGRKNLVGKSTAEVAETIIKAATSSMGNSYCEFLEAKAKQPQPLSRTPKHASGPSVGTAMIFVTHAREDPFLDLVEALVEFFKFEPAGADPNPVLWIDIFSENLHSTLPLTADYLNKNFKAGMKSLGRNVMVAAPWDDPSTLSQAWCLWQIYCTVSTKSVFDVAMSPAQEQKFVEDMAKDGAHDAINKMLAGIDIKRSKAESPEILQQIFEAVRQTAGIAGINTVVFKEMRQWAVQALVGAISKGINPIRLKFTLAKLYQGQGKYLLAEPLFKECLLTSKDLMGETHPDTLESMKNLAQLYKAQGKYKMAEPLYKATWETAKQAYGDKHADTLGALNNLAWLYLNQGKYELAEPLFKQGLEIRREVLGQYHAETVRSLSVLAELYRTRGKYELAEPLLREVLDTKKRLHGDTHPDYLIAMQNLAALYKKQGQFDKAEELLTECLMIKKSKLGITHPETIMTLNNLATFLEERGRRAEAKKLREEWVAENS